MKPERDVARVPTHSMRLQISGEKMQNTVKHFAATIAIRAHYQILGHKGFGVTELRIFDPRPMVAYVDNVADGIRLVLDKDGHTSGIYVGVQPRNVDLFELAPNCWKPATGYPNSNCASDSDIEYITAVFFDIDVVSLKRRKGYPASDEELQKSLKAAQLLAQQDGLALSCAICCSGNGHHVLASIVPIAVDSEQIPLQFRQFCQERVARVTAQVQGAKIDSVFNPGRVMRLMGTLNRKGNPLPGRPHRRAHFVTEPMPAASMALHAMILNTDIPIIKPSGGMSTSGIKCDLKKIESCEFIKWCRKHATEVTEPQWFAMITNLARLANGPERIHEISKLDDVRYDWDRTQRLIRRMLANGYGPTSCESLIKLGFHCRKLRQCTTKAPMYLTSLYTIYRR